MTENADRLQILLSHRRVLCCGALQDATPISIEKECVGVVITDFPALQCPKCGTAYTDVELGALVEEAVAGTQGPLTMAQVVDRVAGSL